MTIGASSHPDSPRNNYAKTGPPLVGIILNWFLFGILIMQYLMYLNHIAKRDSKRLQAIVHIIFLLDTVQTIMVMNDALTRYVYNFGDYTTTLDSSLSGPDSPFMDALIAMIIQLVYCWRIWILSNWRVFPCITAFLAFVAGVSGMVGGMANAVLKYVDNAALTKWYTGILLWCWTSVVTDILIAGSMVYLLRSRSKGVGQSARLVAKRVLVLTLETNGLTAIVTMWTAIVPLIPPLQFPFTTVVLTGGFILGKLYSNCFMVLLNQRMYYKDPSRGPGQSIELGTLEARTGLCSEISNFRTNEGVTITQVSSTQVSEATTQVDLKHRTSEEIDLGEAKKGG